MKKKYTNQASKYHSNIYSEDGPKSKAAPNYNKADTEIKSRELKPSPASMDLTPSTLDEAKSLRKSYKAGQESGDSYIKSATQPYKELADLKEEGFNRAIKSGVDKAAIKRLESREKALGGSKKVTKKIRKKEKLKQAGEYIRKNADSLGAGAAIVGGGLYATFVAGKPKKKE